MTDRLPRRVRPHHRVEDRQKFTHARGERDLPGLTRSDEAKIERSNDRVASGRDQRAHVEHGADRRPPPHEPPASPGPAVTGERRDADQRRNLLAVQLTEVGEVRQERAAPDGTDARHPCGGGSLWRARPGCVRRVATATPRSSSHAW